MAKKKVQVEEEIVENISVEPLDEVMSDRFAVYAKYVIQDRAIPDARDGLKPVQRRILFSMYSDGNTINKPTRKCAHTVGAVMGKYHPHGDSSIYEALARMSQDWKLRYPLVDFQGNNGSIDGDSPAAYRYTESRLSELSNELLRDIDKDTVDMALTFDDTAFEPIVLPSRFPNLLVNGTEGIAVALATEIPPHNLREVSDAIIYRINHKNATVEDLMEIVPAPDFPTGGIIYDGPGLQSIYQTGHGRIEVAARAKIVEAGNINQIIITEIPYKVVKINIVYEIDKIRHSKAIDGILEVRDETDFNGIRIVVDLRKDAPADLILAYLMDKTSLRTSYTANMVAIVDGRPKTMNLLDFVDAYVNHQKDVVTRRCKFDLKKSQSRLHIINGLIIATLNINEVVNIIRQSKDKQDSKANLIKRFNLSPEQAESIVMMPLYKLSHTDNEILVKEKEEVEANIDYLTGILSDEDKLNRLICSDLKTLVKKYGDDRRTTVEEKEGSKPIDKRLLISKDRVMVAITKDGYMKRSTIKSYNSSIENHPLPELKPGDSVIFAAECWTTDVLLIFASHGKYINIPVYKLEENKWRERGIHVNTLVNLPADETLVRVINVEKQRDDIYTVLLTRRGQIKRTCLSEYQLLGKPRMSNCMKLMKDDELADVRVSTGDANVVVFSENGLFTMFNENDLTPISLNTSGVKSMSNLKKNNAVGLAIIQKDERKKVLLLTDKACYRIFDSSKAEVTQRLGKVQVLFNCFKRDIHKLVKAFVLPSGVENYQVEIYDSTEDPIDIVINDFAPTDPTKYAKHNIDELSAKVNISDAFAVDSELVDEKLVSQPLPQPTIEKEEENIQEQENNSSDDEENGKVEQISLFDDFD